MKDKTARILAIIALVFMAVFVVTLTMTIIDHTILHGSIGYLALGSGVFVAIIFIALKADGRGFSMTKINNEIEMQKLDAERAPEEESREESGEEKENATAGSGEEGNPSSTTEGGPPSPEGEG